MKKYYIIIIAFLGCLGLQAKDMTGLKIYIIRVTAVMTRTTAM